MKNSNDPYGIGRMKEKEKLENARMEKIEKAIGEMVKELRNIGDKLEKIEKKI
ncbi:hypothetical protein [Paramaledivibacter caminithermalis]|uniref:Uncharacterized protein n=1 Tax=Paramaledivibacter caminithermalis (strain DSM 15212 / CIP 107654 / DViRD3) TaxID=1121301 RepID=A0A1M6LYC5_PARC5|nr:hypothetical protein [Paramaledivibacter caminithermalis]SHJ76043.1 hypothetical protein SAMN02745912_00970 [Paramaledivibacter caminithermalis DSM 15212]